MKYGLMTAMAALAAMTAAMPVQAGALAFGWVTPGNANTSLGLSYSQTNSGVTLTAYGLTASAGLTQPASAGPSLYAKNGGAGETGLGMATDPAGDHEISAAAHDGIQIDFAQALAASPKNAASLMISSAQSGEGWAIYGSNTLYTIAGLFGQPLLSGVGGSHPSVTVTLPDWGQFTYYTLMSTDPGGCEPDANIVLGTVTIPGPVTTTDTPEPGSMLMVGSALVVIGLVMKKARKKA